MRYVGGKQRLIRYIVPRMLEGAPPDQPWVEPFVGSGGVIAAVGRYEAAGHAPRVRLGADTNPFLIALLQAVQGGWQPPAEVSNDRWRELRGWKDDFVGARQLSLEWAAEIAFAGFACSYAARWFEGYARDRRGTTNYAANGRRALLEAAPLLQGVDFRCCDYQQLALPDRPSIIYCDPPYTGCAKNYYRFGAFGPGTFWQWATDMAAAGHKVFVSEFEAPTDVFHIRLVWQKDRAVSLTRDTGQRWRTDCLFEVLP